MDTFKEILKSSDKELLEVWEKVLKEAKKTKNYDKNKRYGTYQIIQELNTSYKDVKNKTVYDYPELNGNIETLKTKLKDYYKENIEKKLFEYELLK